MPKNRSFLTAAKWVLEREGEPLTIDLILEKAIDGEELETRGNTPINTMRSKLSQHIRKLGHKSAFIRVGPNKFGLRKWELKEYDEHPLIKKYQGEFAVCIPQSMVDDIGRPFGYSQDIEKFITAFKATNTNYIDRDDAEFNNEYKQLISYIMLFNQQGDILSFKRGTYSTANKKLLEGATCIGFGGHVNKSDFVSTDGNYRLFSYQHEGIKQAAIREIKEELRFDWPDDRPIEYIGMINDDSSPTGLRHLGIVMKGILPSNFSIDDINVERSINKLRFLSPSTIWEQFHELEFWSQLLCKTYWKKPDSQSSVVITGSKKRLIDGPISIVGEIATGKTIISKFLADRYGLPIVTTRLCVAALTGTKDFKRGSREMFSQKALELVLSEDGIMKLAKKIIDEIEASGKNVVIVDGVRNLRTNELLAKKYKNLTTIFVDSPRDDSYNFYKLRVKRDATIHEFRNARHHDVEREVYLFKNRANIRIYNGGSIDELFSQLGKWFDGKIQIPD